MLHNSKDGEEVDGELMPFQADKDGAIASKRCAEVNKDIKNDACALEPRHYISNAGQCTLMNRRSKHVA